MRSIRKSLSSASQIDAGGEQLAALSGAIASIAAGRVGILAFAFGGQGAWKHGQLGEVVARLDELGYTCYLAGGCLPL
jgi:hypothetical protein